METYIDYWIDSPDHFRALFSMAGTIEDRRFPDGVYFGQSESVRRAVAIFEASIEDYLAELGAETSPALSRRLAAALLSAAHGAISLPLGAPTRKWPDIRGTGRLIIVNLIDAWTMKIEAARKTERWPKISINTFS